MNIRELLIKVGFDGGSSGGEIDKLDKKTDRLKNSARSAASALMTIGTVLLTGGVLKGLIGTADAMQNLQSQIGNSTGDMATANAKFNELSQHAKDTRTDLDAYVGSWAKMNQGIAAFGGSADMTTGVLDTLSAAFAVNGTATESANAALFQLSQTFQSGVVQGEEMNSFLDAQGTLAREVMINIAGTVPAYKKMQAAGKVTAKMLAEGIIKQQAKYVDQLRKMPMTVGNAWTLIRNDVKTAIGNVNNSLQIIPRLAKAIVSAWDRVVGVFKAFVRQSGGLEAAAKNIKQVLTPLTLLIGVMMGFKALAFLTTPIGLITSLGLAIGLLYNDYKTWKDGGDSFINWAEWEPAIQNVIKAIDWVIAKFKELTGAKNDTQAAIEGLGAVIATVIGVKAVGAVTSLLGVLGNVGIVAKSAMGQIGLLIAAGTAASQVWDKYIVTPEQANGPTTAGGVFQKGSVLGDIWDKHFADMPVFNGNYTGSTTPAGYAAPPQTAPGGTVNTTNTTTNNVTNTYNVTQQPGESGQAFAERVAKMATLPPPSSASNIGDAGRMGGR